MGLEGRGNKNQCLQACHVVLAVTSLEIGCIFFKKNWHIDISSQKNTLTGHSFKKAFVFFPGWLYLANDGTITSRGSNSMGLKEKGNEN